VIIDFEVTGVPIPQPRGRACRVGSGVRVIEAPGAHPIHEWKDRIRWHAAKFRPAEGPLEGPLRLVVRFRMPRPQPLQSKKWIHRKVPHSRRPDLDNLLKAVMDALSGLWVDDALVASVVAQKAYVMPWSEPGVTITVMNIEEAETIEESKGERRREG
jgi:Holliday junction resolvase RusA-like endonuclease